MTTTLPSPDLPTRRRPPDAGADQVDRRRRRRDDIAGMVFSTWTVIGLFLDGWSHNAERPETFFSPWHAVLYSGFVAGATWFAVTGALDRRAGVPSGPTDRLLLVGFGLFGLAGFSDMVWHLVFGIEADIEALLSPSHLLLMFAGLLVLTAPVRQVLADRSPAATGAPVAPVAASVPVVVAVTLAVSVVLFFLQFTVVLHLQNPDVFTEGASVLEEIYGIDSVLVTNAVLCGAMLWMRRTWGRTPVGTYTLLFGASTLLTAGLSGFEHLMVVAPMALAGVVADALVWRGAGERTLSLAAPAVAWSAWFAMLAATSGLSWTPELWTGTIVLTVLSGYGLHLLQRAPASPVR